MKFYVYNYSLTNGKLMVLETSAKMQEAKRVTAFDANQNGTKVVSFRKVFSESKCWKGSSPDNKIEWLKSMLDNHRENCNV